MARPVQAGLQYFPFDVDFFNDDKVELISSEFGAKGEVIAIRLLCHIYRNGYFYQWGEDESLLFAKRVGNGVTGALVNEVVIGLVKRSFFDKGVFDRFKILTSKGIQTRYLEAKKRSEKVSIIKELALIPINATITDITESLTQVNDEISTQSKVKESKDINVAFFNSFKTITGKGIRSLNEKTKSQISARIRDGYTLEDFETAIKNCLSDKYHQENPHFLTPEFITRPDKLEKYFLVSQTKPKSQTSENFFGVPNHG